MSNTISTVFTVILLAGALVAGAAQQAFWVIIVIAVMATVANAVSPAARADRAKQGKGLMQALPGLVLNQLIWVNLVFLIGYGAAWAMGGPLIAAPVWLTVGLSAAGLAGTLAASLRG
ncbi:hypothetical protein [Rhodovulum adriaticum]|uniref:Uncharacterized protein n=1 Tax=Rhodovulum adriaticum TaxID=35804 RepID=A0A4R2NJ52_RHOAD|nr:hypothetical protein [Rhodovulum adriaticum]MBK1635908.1 hypothetical protein [Rhodovulum adriaticum]TCP21450.1 hypothetical protein EV656_111103 [Rhodovulum adriaticum]